jgi:hypothetical protein
VRPGPRSGGEGGLEARLEDRALKLSTVLDARNVPAGALEKTDGGPRFPVNTTVICAYSFFQNEKAAGRTSIVLGTVIGFHRGGIGRMNISRRVRFRGFGAGACHRDGIAWLCRTFFGERRRRTRIGASDTGSWSF